MSSTKIDVEDEAYSSFYVDSFNKDFSEDFFNSLSFRSPLSNDDAVSVSVSAFVFLRGAIIITRERILMPQNLTKKTTKMPQKIAKKPQKKHQKSLNKSFKTHSTKKYLLNLNNF